MNKVTHLIYNICVTYCEHIHYHPMTGIRCEKCLISQHSSCRVFADLKRAQLHSVSVCCSADRGDEANSHLVLLLPMLSRFIFTFPKMKAISRNEAAFCTLSAPSGSLWRGLFFSIFLHSKISKQQPGSGIIKPGTCFLWPHLAALGLLTETQTPRRLLGERALLLPQLSAAALDGSFSDSFWTLIWFNRMASRRTAGMA